MLHDVVLVAVLARYLGVFDFPVVKFGACLDLHRGKVHHMGYLETL